MTMTTRLFLLTAAIAAALLVSTTPRALAAAQVGETCSASSASSCGAGLRCTSCVPPPGTGPAACARTAPADPKTHGTGLPFNRYAWLTTHNSFAVVGTKSPLGSAIISPPNQEDPVSSQLRNGVRGLMLDAYDFNGDVWLCHSFNGKCMSFTAYTPALHVLKEVAAFLDANPAEVVTVFLEDYTAPGSLSNVFNAAGLTKFWFPVADMPKNGGDKEWPLLRDMIAKNQRLVVFSSKKGKEGTEGLAHEWDYVVENQYGSDGLADAGKCTNRAESRPMDSTGQKLVLMNFFMSNPSQSWACWNNSAPLLAKLDTCYQAAGKRWPNYIAVDFYMRSSGGGAPLATDVANGRLQCGADNIAYCKSPGPAAASPGPAAASAAVSPGPAPIAAAGPPTAESPGPAIAAPPMVEGPSAAAPRRRRSHASRRRREAAEKAAGTGTEAPDTAPVSSSAAATASSSEQCIVSCFFSGLLASTLVLTLLA